VTEVDPVCALQALMAGHEVVQLEDALATADLVVTATGNRDIITLEHMSRMKDNAIVCNMGHFDCEIQVEALNGAPDVSRTRMEPGVDRYTFPDGHSVLLLAEVACQPGLRHGHPAFMSCSFSNQVLAQSIFYAASRPGLHRPKAPDEQTRASRRGAGRPADPADAGPGRLSRRARGGAVQADDY
jgi:adenosylhomocysteinase